MFSGLRLDVALLSVAYLIPNGLVSLGATRAVLALAYEENEQTYRSSAAAFELFAAAAKKSRVLWWGAIECTGVR